MTKDKFQELVAANIELGETAIMLKESHEDLEKTIKRYDVQLGQREKEIAALKKELADLRGATDGSWFRYIAVYACGLTHKPLSTEATAMDVVREAKEKHALERVVGVLEIKYGKSGLYQRGRFIPVNEIKE